MKRSTRSRQFVGVNQGLLAEFTRKLDDSFICLAPDRHQAEVLLSNLLTLHGEEVALLPDWNRSPDSENPPGKNIQAHRLQTLLKLKKKQIKGLVLPVKSLVNPLLKPTVIPSVTLVKGNNYSLKKLLQQLNNLGFQRQSLAQQRGDFALRGDLLDIFPENFRYPIRISLFDEEIEEINFYHPNTQMQADKTPELPIELTLQNEFALSHKLLQQLQENLRLHGYNRESEILDFSSQPSKAADWFGLWPRHTTWPEHLLPNSQTLIYRPADCLENARRWDEQLTVKTENSICRETYRPLLPVLKNLTDTNCYFFSTLDIPTELTEDLPAEPLGRRINLDPEPSLKPKPIQEFIELIEREAQTSSKLIIHCGEQSFCQRLTELLTNKFGCYDRIDRARITLEPSPWHGSFQLAQLTRISLDDFFNRTISRGRISTSAGSTEYLESFEELSVGDLIVHEDFGIGRFKGLKLVITETQKRDCIHLEYSGEDKLFLPPDQMSRVQKYIAGAGFKPPLSSLSSNRWQKIKNHVQNNIDDLADELLELYSHREEEQTTPYKPDSLEQTQFEASFPHRETADQQAAIEAVKKDLESNKPMDRLICGDSGYGKTEVALRAAFKAVNNNKQVALLAPTTILSRQHYERFSRRFSFFPYRVEMLNRFQTAAETKSIIQAISNGNVDIVVGTHKLFKQPLEFADLGLFIIDEEQRFGVRQKEQLKLRYKDIDVLTISATPIPRTLYMSLSGVQDISVINTPPEERSPINITVGPFDKKLARSALRQEYNRGGQSFWIYNRVEKIDQVAAYVQQLVPEAVVDFAHGQLPKAELREKMDRFYAGEIDLLVSTTIVEAGLDCPRANTMIIQNAHRFGLAQLYQLRGRVGRSHEQSYAYLFYPQQARLTEQAEARLQTIIESSQNGSGFRLAMRDLEIRGAGNILGKDQHGNIKAVGFPLYCRLLQRSIRRIREDFEPFHPFPRLKFPGEYYIPRSYIPDEKQIISQYRALSTCRDYKQTNLLATQWKDTFGPLPDPVKQIFRRHCFKILVHQKKLDDIRYQNNRLNLRFKNQQPDFLGRSARLVGGSPVCRGNRYFIRNLTPERLLTWLKILLEEQEKLLDL